MLILSWEYPPIVEGGLARHVRKLAEGLVRTGVEVHVLARGGGRLAAVEDRHGVTVHRVREPEFPKADLGAFVRWVDAMNDDMRAAGAALGDALVDGPVARFRALVMAALLAILGLTPMAVSHAVGSETQRPFAVVIIGGMVTTLLVALSVLPVVYQWITPKRLGTPAQDDQS